MDNSPLPPLFSTQQLDKYITAGQGISATSPQFSTVFPQTVTRVDYRVTMSKTKPLHHGTPEAPLDLLIVGAGISGVNISHYINQEFPHWDWLVVDSNSDIGGTWNTFRYPGIRSDSDMATFSLPFKPWPHPNTLGSAQQIQDYLREAATEAGMDDRLDLSTWVSSANFHTDFELWEVTALQAAPGVNNAEGLGVGEERRITFWAKRIHFASGYYRHSSGYTADIPGIDSFTGRAFHPQNWPEDLDIRGKKAVIIGSGATSVTLLPAMHNMGAEVTMLQRTPTYIAPLPNTDQISTATAILGKRRHSVARNLHIYRDMAQYHLCQTFPILARGVFWLMNRAFLPAAEVRRNFRPPYNPWDQRVCKSPDGDFFQALRGGAKVVTGKIQTVVEDGIVLDDGQKLDADIIIIATGLQLQAFGNADMQIDGTSIDRPEMAAYRCLMLSDMPNLTYTIGYVNQSWTLRADMTSRYLVRLWKHMEQEGLRLAAPVLPDGMVTDIPMLEMESGYIKRSVHELPRQGQADPWRMKHDYVRERRVIEHGDVLADMVFDEDATAAAVARAHRSAAVV